MTNETTVDFTQMEQGDSLYINETGEYTVRIDAFKKDTNKNGKEFIEFKFKTTEGRIHHGRFYTTPKALFRLHILAEAALREEVSVSDPNFDLKLLLDKWVLIVLNSRTYEKTDGSEGTAFEIGIIERADKPTDSKIENLRDKVGAENDPF